MADKAAGIEKAITDVSNIVAQFVPLVALVGVAVRTTIALARANGVDVATFEEEMVKYEAQRDALGAAIREFRAKHGGTP